MISHITLEQELMEPSLTVSMVTSGMTSSRVPAGKQCDVLVISDALLIITIHDVLMLLAARSTPSPFLSTSINT